MCVGTSMKTILYPLLIILIVGAQACSQGSDSPQEALTTAGTGSEPLPEHVLAELSEQALGDTVVRTEEEWRQLLTPAEFEVLREDGTEPPFENEFNDNKRRGVYSCAACGNPMFTSETKYESGTGWPSFWAPIAEKRVKEEQDLALGMVRTEVVCARCGSHLGHVFPDGPPPTGLRYCLNSISLDFEEI